VRRYTLGISTERVTSSSPPSPRYQDGSYAVVRAPLTPVPPADLCSTPGDLDSGDGQYRTWSMLGLERKTAKPLDYFHLRGPDKAAKTLTLSTPTLVSFVAHNFVEWLGPKTRADL
jgi:hypothetical protein